MKGGIGWKLITLALDRDPWKFYMMFLSVFHSFTVPLKSSQIVHFRRMILRIFFLFFNEDHENFLKTFCSKLINCLGTNWEHKNLRLSSKLSNLIQLLVFVTFSICRFPRIFIEKTLKKYANNLVKNKKIQYDNGKEILDFIT